MSKALAHDLRLRGIDVTTVAEAERQGLSDLEQLEFATSQGSAICTGNVEDFLQLHAEFLSSGKAHARIIIIPRQGYSVGEQIRRLTRLIKSKSAESIWSNIEFLGNW